MTTAEAKESLDSLAHFDGSFARFLNSLSAALWSGQGMPSRVTTKGDGRQSQALNGPLHTSQAFINSITTGLRKKLLGCLRVGWFITYPRLECRS